MSSVPEQNGTRPSSEEQGRPIALSETVLSAHMGDESVLLCTASRRYFQLNATGQHVWLGLERGLGRGALLDSLVDTFDVERPIARRELDRLLGELRAHGLVDSRKRRNGNR
ncbi:MAG: PqqD family protein [Gemmatimonadota bacterium]|nr:PqqD family protein [Gemmatimonadota bacterium]